MLSITAKVRTLTQELDSATHLCKDLLSTLENCNQSTNLTEEIGVFARQMPEWKILNQEHKQGIDFIRQICTGERSIAEAIELTKKLMSELQSTRRLINL